MPSEVYRLTSLNKSEDGDTHDERADVAVTWLSNRNSVNHVHLRVRQQL